MGATRKPRLLLDTNVLYQLSNPHHPASGLIREALAGHWDIIVCQPVLREFLRLVAKKSKPLPRLTFLMTLVVSGGSQIATYAPWEPLSADVEASRHLISDAGDVVVLLCAIQARADAVITYNLKHFGQQQRVPAMTPEAWLALRSPSTISPTSDA